MDFPGRVFVLLSGIRPTTHKGTGHVVNIIRKLASRKTIFDMFHALIHSPVGAYNSTVNHLEVTIGEKTEAAFMCLICGPEFIETQKPYPGTDALNGTQVRTCERGVGRDKEELLKYLTGREIPIFEQTERILPLDTEYDNEVFCG